MINKLLEKHIPSKDYLDYIRQNDITHSDYEVAAILSHCISDPFRLHEELEFISNNTSDEKLKEEIENKINNDNRLYEMFKNNSEKEAVYVVYEYDKEYDEHFIYGYFYHFDKALEKAMESGQEFKIEKQKVQGDNPKKTIAHGAWNPHYDKDAHIETYQMDDYEDNLGTILYKEDGEIKYFYVKDLSILNRTDDELLNDIYKDNFENVYMYLEHPFEIGDIVKDVRNNQVGIVELSKEEYDAFSEKVKGGFYADDFDSGTIVSYLHEDGCFVHDHPLPFFLEKYEPESEDGNFELLTSASYLLKHQTSLDHFTEAYDAYRNK